MPANIPTNAMTGESLFIERSRFKNYSTAARRSLPMVTEMLAAPRQYGDPIQGRARLTGDLPNGP
jgi:hypothetical protein